MVCPSSSSATGWVSDRDERYLLQVGVVIFFVRFPLRRCNLLDACSCRQDRSKVVDVHFIECLRVRQIVQVDIGSYDLLEIHAGFFKVVEEIAHSLAQLMLRGGGIDPSVRPRNKATLRGTIQGVSCENAG